MCNCTCSCNCEIDTSKPEEYEVQTPYGWKQVVSIFDTGCEKKPAMRYGVFYDQPANCNGYDRKWCSSNRIRKKPKWKPTPGKYYMVSDAYNGPSDPCKGQIRKIIKVDFLPPSSYSFVTESAVGAVPETWKYCWPIDKSKFGE